MRGNEAVPKATEKRGKTLPDKRHLQRPPAGVRPATRRIKPNGTFNTRSLHAAQR
jgi:hypothetical protein